VPTKPSRSVAGGMYRRGGRVLEKWDQQTCISTLPPNKPTLAALLTQV
jgi:hypothetical protein